MIDLRNHYKSIYGLPSFTKRTLRFYNHNYVNLIGMNAPKVKGDWTAQEHVLGLIHDIDIEWFENVASPSSCAD